MYSSFSRMTSVSYVLRSILYKTVPAREYFHHWKRILPGIRLPLTESLMAAVSTLKALIAKAADLLDKWARGDTECKVPVNREAALEVRFS